MYYKRAKDGKWMGPGRVVFQDGKVIFIRNGANVIRVSANRIIKAGTELAKRVFEKDSANIPVDHVALPDFSQREIDHRMTDQGELGEEGTTTPTNDQIEAIPVNGNSMDQREYDQTQMNPIPPRSATAVIDPPTSVISGGKVLLQKNDRIQYQEGNNTVRATVTGRAGKATGKNKNWFNIVKDGQPQGESVNFDGVNFERIGEEPEEAFLALIPRCEQDSKECIDAKVLELQKLKEFDTVI